MIKSGSEMVTNLACENPEPRFDDSIFNEIDKFLPISAIFIGEDWLSCRYIDRQGDDGNLCKEGADFPIEVLDVLLGPF